MRADLSQWKGLALIAAICSSTVWLAATGQLELYVAPQYSGFATVMSVIGLIATALSVLRTHSHETVSRSKRAVLLSMAATAGALLVAGTMIVLPPATLTSTLASQREINSTGLDDTRVLARITTQEGVSDEAFANLSVYDWASLLRQTSDVGFYSGKTATAVGFITADPEDPENMFYISRFFITHCAIDAQAVGIPVHMENWKNSFEADQWVDASGSFDTNPSARSSQAIVFTPDTIDVVDEPREPYLY